MEGFRRFTNLAATIHLLQNRKISLFDPANWDDKNDAFFMAEYKRRKHAKTLLALCFAECAETYHHWKVFSHGADGVCIGFDKEFLVSTFKNDPKIIMGPAIYKRIKEVKNIESIDLDRIPFLKRHPYEDEREYRVVYVDPDQFSQNRDYSIEISWITHVTLSPWMPEAFAQSVKKCLHSIDGCGGISIYQSTLVDNESWKSLVDRIEEAPYVRDVKY